MSAARLIGLLQGPDRPGLVARIANGIFQRGGTILHADQHHDAETGVFVQRLEWIPGDREREPHEFQRSARDLGMEVRVLRSDSKPKVAVFVSKIPHCFQDLVLRWRQGEFHGELVCAISNHPDLAKFSAAFDLPFHHIPVAPGENAAAEAAHLQLLRAEGIELVVLARYMQVLSGEFLDAVKVPVINIHHSFLPAFAGGKPYHQAHQRGVKLIGATAHYATRDLDEGPIIAQDVTRITHRHSVEDLVRKGRDLEKAVFAQAIRAHLDGRVLVCGKKTVVFD